MSGSAVNVTKLGYISVETPDVDRMVDYYEGGLDFAVVERSAREAYLTTTFDHHSVVITQADAPRVRGVVGYEIRESVADAERRLTAAGYDVSRRSDIAPATPDVLVLAEPTTGVEIHLYDQQSSSGVQGYPPLRPTKLGHVAGFVDDLAPVQAFYEGLLGFRWSDTIGDFFVFLRCNSDHHAANFMASKKFSGLHHVAYEMRSLDHLQTMLDHLAKRDIRLHWGPGRHGAGHNVFTYHKDPDGNNVELFTQLDVIHDEKGYFEPRPWHEDFPQYPKTWEVDLAAVNSWGPINFEMIEH
ncbi:VOC family protein [Microbacterium sp. RD1]|uniref:VOC family protein n=1 Tax=Microbacterium sp. RD1 TaxID=3457313 RepID=UPI003FA5DC4F